MYRIPLILWLLVACAPRPNAGSLALPTTWTPPPPETLPTDCPTETSLDRYLPARAWPGAVEGAPYLRIAGVAISEGQPLPGATVVLDGSGARVTTDAQGVFDFGPQPQARHSVLVRRDNVIGMALVDSRNPTVELKTIRVQAAVCPVEVEGVVRSGIRQPLVGVTVSLSGYKDLSTSISADGHYRLCIPDIASRWIRFEAPGMGTTQELAGLTREPLDVTLVPEGVIEGTVVRDGRPAPGARVMLVADGSAGAVNQVVQAGAGGRFLIHGVRLGAHEVVARVDGAVTMNPFPVDVMPGAISHIVVTLAPTAIVRGRVYERGRPAPGELVSVRPEGPRAHVAFAISGPDGSFEIRDAPIGPAVVALDPDRIAGAARLEIPPDGLVDVPLEVAPAGRICGRILRNGRPAAGVTIHSSGPRFAVATSDAGGRYMLRGLVPGVYGFSPGDPRRVVRIEGTETVSHVDLADASSAWEAPGPEDAGSWTLRGKVVDAAGAPQPYAWVIHAKPGGAEPMGADDRAEDLTGPDGTFVLEGLTPGETALQAVTVDGQHGRLTVEADATEAVIQLQPTGAIAVDVLDFASLPEVGASGIGGALDDDTGDIRWYGNHVVLRGLPAGQWFVSAVGAGEAASAVASVTPGQTTQLTLRSGGSAELTGRVLEHGSYAPLVGLDCRPLALTPEGVPLGRFDAHTSTNRDGRFAIMVPAGEVSIECREPSTEPGVHAPAGTVVHLVRNGRTFVALEAVRRTGNRSFGIGFDLQDPRAIVKMVLPGSPAATAGILPGDSILTIDGVSSTLIGAAGVQALMAALPPNRSLTLAILRGTQQLDYTVH